MPNRILRDGILTSERVNALGWEAELFYRRLMSVVDDFGRVEFQIGVLIARCYPLQIDRVTPSNVRAWLTECIAQELITEYSSGLKNYLQINDFGQRERASKCPPPPDVGGVRSDDGELRRSAARATTPTPTPTTNVVSSPETKPEVSLAPQEPGMSPLDVLAELEPIYFAAGCPIPDNHKQLSIQLMLDIPGSKRYRIVNYVKHALISGKWPNPAKTKGLLNLLRDGDWDVEITPRTLPAPIRAREPTRSDSATEEAMRRFREKEARKNAANAH